MMRLRAFYSHLNTPLSIKNNRLYGSQSKAPVHWGVNATPKIQTAISRKSKAPVHWGVNATECWQCRKRRVSKAPVHWGVNAT